MSMFDVHRVSVEVGGEEISFETGKLARQAGGAVVARSGDTMVLGTATVGNLRDVDFLPLTVDVEERHYAAGKIPGSFFRREGSPGREGDADGAHDRPAAAAAVPEGMALRDADRLPAAVGRVRASLRHPRHERRLGGRGRLPDSGADARRRGADREASGDFVVNPSEETYAELEMDLVVSGSSDALLMVECGSVGVSEAEVLDALDIAHEEIKKICATIEELRARRASRSSRSPSPRSTRICSSRSGPRSGRSWTRRRRSPRSSPGRRRSTRSRRTSSIGRRRRGRR